MSLDRASPHMGAHYTCCAANIPPIGIDVGVGVYEAKILLLHEQDILRSLFIPLMSIH
jgi:hypothetical protein